MKKREPNDSNIIGLIYQGPLEKVPWQSFLHELRIQMDCDVAAISLRIRRDRMAAINVWDRRQPISSEDLRLARQSLATYGHLDPLTKALKRAGDLFTLDDVVPREELVASDYYKYVMAPFDIEYQLGMHVAEPGGWRSNVGLMNSRRGSNFGRGQKNYFKAIRPHLEKALQLFARMKRNELELATLEEALDRLAIAVYVLDADGHVIDVNGRGRRVASRNDGLAIVDERLVLTQLKDNRRLGDSINKALAAREAGHGERFVDAIRVSRKASPPLSILVRAVHVSDEIRNYASPSVIIYACDQTQSDLAPDRFVAEIFGLSATEAKLATLLANGFTLAQVATKLGLTENTVRSYAKRTFEKAGVNRQADLVRLILTSVAPLAASTSS
jgi:DNA-binding CsgD family transcriptional regulator/PAS domain-containing protein